MKQLLPIFAMSAIAVGLIMFALEDQDGAPNETAAPPLPLRETLPAPNTRAFVAQFPVAIQVEAQQQDIPESSTPTPLSESEPWYVQQASYLEPFQPTTQQPPAEEQSIFIPVSQPVSQPTNLYYDLDADAEDAPRRIPKESTLLSSEREDDIEDVDIVEDDFGPSDDDLFEAETRELLSDSSFDDFKDDNFESDPSANSFDTGGSDFAVSNAAPPWIPTEAEQIGALLQQIGNQRATNAAHAIRWSLDDAIAAALAHSNRVSSLSIESIEALQNVGVEYGEFDVAAFVTQSFRDSAEPVGSSIDTASGTQPIVNENDLNIAYGLRQQLRSGGDFEISQSYQFRDNDSGILIPEDQAFSRLNGRLTKELLRGAGRSIAMNQVLVAYHDATAQRAESVANIADHLNDVMTAYWDIFTARGALFASMENRQLAVEVLRELNARQDIDAEPNLIAQSEATIRQRELQIIQANADLVQAQIQFISLVNAPELLDNSGNIEILPQVSPDLGRRELDIASRINTAIQRRPEIGDIVEQIKSAQVSNHLSLNELLPRLSLSLEASLNGLEGDNQLGAAIGNQFENDLTYQVGVDFEVPILNRRARFNKRRTELVVARLRADWQGLIQEVKADVLNNAQQFEATQLRLETQKEVLKFSANELRYLGLRKTVAPKETDNVSFALTQVLSAQDRQVEAKSDFIAAVADKYRAIFELNRATGILINPDVIPQDGGPTRPGFFSVYHHYIEERGSFEGPLNFVEGHTRAISDQHKLPCGGEHCNSASCSCQSCESGQAQAVHSTCGPACEATAGFTPVGAELHPVTTPSPRYPLR